MRSKGCHSGELKLNLPHRIYRVYGRQFLVAGRDGSTSMAAVFDYKRRLYLIEAKALPGGITADTEFALTRFQQSLTFTDAARTAPRTRSVPIARLVPAPLPRPQRRGHALQPAGPDDPRCQVQ